MQCLSPFRWQILRCQVYYHGHALLLGDVSLKDSPTSPALIGSSIYIRGIGCLTRQSKGTAPVVLINPDRRISSCCMAVHLTPIEAILRLGTSCQKSTKIPKFSSTRRLSAKCPLPTDRFGEPLGPQPSYSLRYDMRPALGLHVSLGDVPKSAPLTERINRCFPITYRGKWISIALQ